MKADDLRVYNISNHRSCFYSMSADTWSYNKEWIVGGSENLLEMDLLGYP